MDSCPPWVSLSGLNRPPCSSGQSSEQFPHRKREEASLQTPTVSSTPKASSSSSSSSTPFCFGGDLELSVHAQGQVFLNATELPAWRGRGGSMLSPLVMPSPENHKPAVSQQVPCCKSHSFFCTSATGTNGHRPRTAGPRTPSTGSAGDGDR